MKISALDRLNVQADLSDVRSVTRLVYACVPVMVRQAFDVDLQSGNNMTTGDGLGETPSQWRIYAMQTHIRNVDLTLMTFGHVPPGVELGDLLINVGPRDLATIQQVMADDNGYLFVDGNPYMAISLLPSGLGQIEWWTVDARARVPQTMAPGYDGVTNTSELVTLENGTSFWQFEDGSNIEWG